MSGWMLSKLVPTDQIQVRVLMLQQNEDGEIEVQQGGRRLLMCKWERTLQFDQMMLMIHFGSCWLPNVYMWLNSVLQMDGTTLLKKEMKSFVEIGMIGYNKGVGPTP